MRNVQILLSSVKQVQQFVSSLAPLKGDFELVCGNYVLDARSLMGIFGFDLTKPLNLRVYDASPENMAGIKPFMIDTEDSKQ
jgi:hypothetical protein